MQIPFLVELREKQVGDRHAISPGVDGIYFTPIAEVEVVSPDRIRLIPSGPTNVVVKDKTGQELYRGQPGEARQPVEFILQEKDSLAAWINSDL